MARRQTFLGVLILAALGAAPALFAQQPVLSPAAALERLKEGNTRFATDRPAIKDVGEARRADLAKGQRPFAVIVTCSDSRVAPEIVFDQGLGELFVLRVAGNVTDPAVLGSIEYAIEHLKSPLVVILGHESCGAVRAALEGGHLPDNLAQLIALIHPGENRPTDKDAAVAAGVRANVLYHAGQLTRRSTVIKDFVSSERVRIAAGVYSLKSGRIEWLDLSGK